MGEPGGSMMGVLNAGTSRPVQGSEVLERFVLATWVAEIAELGYSLKPARLALAMQRTTPSPCRGAKTQNAENSSSEL